MLWKQFISVKRMKKICRIIKKSCGIDLVGQLHVRPLFLISLIYRSMIDASDEGVMDQYIWNLGVKNGSVVDGLESTEEQIAILNQLPISEEYRQLKTIAKNIGSSRTKLEQMVKVYKQEDISTLFKKSKKMFAFSKELMLYDRNLRFARRIDKIHRIEPSFFSFGAGHLGGRKGVLNRLKMMGYQVKSYKS